MIYKKLLFKSVGLFCCLTSFAYAAQKPQLVQTFEYDQPDYENFDSRPVELSDGSILERIVSGPNSQMVRFSPSTAARKHSGATLVPRQ